MRPKAIEDKENEIRYNDMGTFFVALKKNDSDDERVRPTWDEVDRRIGCWSRPSEGGVIGGPESTMPMNRRVGPVRLAPEDRERSSPGMKFLTLGRGRLSHAGLIGRVADD